MAERDDRMRRGCVCVLYCLFVTLLAGADPPARAATPPPTFTFNSPSDVVANPPLDNGLRETAPGSGVCTLRAGDLQPGVSIHTLSGGVI